MNKQKRYKKKDGGRGQRVTKGAKARLSLRRRRLMDEKHASDFFDFDFGRCEGLFRSTAYLGPLKHWAGKELDVPAILSFLRISP